MERVRKLLMLAAVVFALFTGATVAIVGSAIHMQNSELVVEHDRAAPHF